MSVCMSEVGHMTITCESFMYEFKRATTPQVQSQLLNWICLFCVMQMYVFSPQLITWCLHGEKGTVVRIQNHSQPSDWSNEVFSVFVGQLGLGNHSSHATPQPVSLPDSDVPKTACCGADCSLLITERGRVLAAGCNR